MTDALASATIAYERREHHVTSWPARLRSVAFPGSNHCQHDLRARGLRRTPRRMHNPWAWFTQRSEWPRTSPN